MAQKSSSSLGDSLKSTFAATVIPLEIVIAFLIYFFILGDPDNFQNGDPSGHPVAEGWRSYLGLIYKGKVVVALLIALLLMTITLDRKSTRLNSSHLVISYAVFCLKKK